MAESPDDETLVSLPLGYKVVRDDDLCVPARISNDDEFREVMTRESAFSFPAAAAGTMAFGPVGTAAGHVVGSAVGLVRHRKIHPDDDLTEPIIPERDISIAERDFERVERLPQRMRERLNRG